MEMVKATVTQVSPLTVTIEGATKAAPGVLVSGTPVAGATCYLAFLPGGNQPPLVFVPGAAGGGGGSMTKAQIDALGVDAGTLDGIDSTGFARVGDSTWHVVGAAGEPALLNGWVNYGGGYGAAAFRKDASGFVHLRGSVKSGSAAIFTLPVGYRPLAIVGLSGQTSGIVEIDVAPDGNIKYYGAAAPAWLTIDGLTFLGEQ